MTRILHKEDSISSISPRNSQSYSAMDNESKIKEVREMLDSLNQKLEALLAERDGHSYMSISEDAISEMYEDDSEIYALKDLKVRYR